MGCKATKTADMHDIIIEIRANIIKSSVCLENFKALENIIMVPQGGCTLWILLDTGCPRQLEMKSPHPHIVVGSAVSE